MKLFSRLMAVNFCYHNLKTEVNTVSVSCEGYDLSNLLSCDPLQREKGFLAEGFTKPPVSIFLKFFCNVDISHILIWTEVGCQKSNGIELSITPGFQRSIAKNNHGNSSQMCQGAVKIGSCKLKNEPGLAFKKFNPHDSPIVPMNLLIRDVNTFSANVMKCASGLEVKIFSTSNSSVPALKKIEVWGRPSRSCPENIKKLIYELWNQTNSDIKCRGKLIKNSSASDKNVKHTENKVKFDHSELLGKDNNPVIPDEFLDPITCNVMVIPMALPSGKVVDLTTLDKFNAAESLWGRIPSDPFTGIPFTSSVYAVPDTALKSRIDQFLLEHGHLEQYKGVGRTIGKGSKQYSNLLNIIKKEDDGTYVDTSSNSNCSSTLKCVVGPSNSQASSSKNREEVPIKNSPFYLGEHRSNVGSKLEAVNHDSSDANRISSSSGIKRKKIPSAKSSSSVVFKRGKNSPTRSNHEEIVEDSLDFALESVLTGLPSYVKTPVVSNDSQQKDSQEGGCGNCHSIQCLFSLPCKHLLCRSCLVKTTSGACVSLKCFVCNHSFSTGDVKRFHLL